LDNIKKEIKNKKERKVDPTNLKLSGDKFIWCMRFVLQPPSPLTETSSNT